MLYDTFLEIAWWKDSEQLIGREVEQSTGSKMKIGSGLMLILPNCQLKMNFSASLVVEFVEFLLVYDKNSKNYGLKSEKYSSIEN